MNAYANIFQILIRMFLMLAETIENSAHSIFEDHEAVFAVTSVGACVYLFCKPEKCVDFQGSEMLICSNFVSICKS